MTITIMFMVLSAIILIPTIIEIIIHILIFPEVLIGLSILTIVLALMFGMLIRKSWLHYEQPPYPGLWIFAPLAVVISIVSIVVNAIGIKNSWSSLIDIMINSIK